MLQELFIKNIATIDELRLNFGGGFEVLTGETGAGKSILVEAIGLILGENASSSLIRDGAGEAVVEAVFDVSKFPEVKTLLEQESLANDDPDELLIKRHISLDGKNKIFVNGQRANLSLLQSVSGKLIDFTGQYQQLELLDADNDVHLLDSFVSDAGILQEYQKNYQDTKAAKAEWVRLEKLEAEKEERLSWLDFQLKEFAKVDVRSPEEEIKLRQTRERVKNASTVAEIGNRAAELLTDGDSNMVAALKQLRAAMEKKSELLSLFGKPLEALEQIRIQVEDLSHDIAKVCEVGELDSDLSLDQIEEKLYLVGQLKKRFGPELSDALNKKKELEAERDLLKNSGENLEKLKKDFTQKFSRLKSSADKLREARNKAKAKLEKSVLEELRYLRMNDVKFVVDIQTAGDVEKFDAYSSTGSDKVSFLLSPNPGLAPRPLAKIASGGETSRIFLALKQILTRERKSGTLIFDEIDTGISGAAVELVGQKLKSLSDRFQVFCVTHHAQIASLAAQHFLVRKDVDKGKTFTRVDVLEKKDRIQEVARLMGGVEISKKNLDFAKEMIEKGR